MGLRTRGFLELSSCYHPVSTKCVQNLPACDQSNISLLYPLFTQPARWKYTKKNQPSAEEDDESDEEEELENFKDEPDGKVVKSSVKSLRLDLILKSGLGLARNKVEAIFYDNKIRVNGEKITKKSMQVDVGDEIDVVKSFSPSNPEHLLIARVQLLATNEKEEGYRVIMRRFKAIIVENYKGQNAWKSSS